MKTNPRRYHEVLGQAPRLALVVPDANALRNRRQVEAGRRAFFAAHDSDWMALLLTPERRRWIN
jgi:hypothetical protein